MTLRDELIFGAWLAGIYGGIVAVALALCP
jgi:hypothetical protein